MFDKDKYLEIIGCPGADGATVATLRQIHRSHQLKLHYDNGYVQTTDFHNFDLDELFDTVVLNGRGGICTDLNFLFHRLLIELGFQVRLLGAGILLPGGNWGSDVEHAVLGVRIDGTEWLADVGHGGVSIMDPVPFTGEPDVQAGIGFRLIRQGGYHVLQYQTHDKPWRIAYRLTTQERDTSEWGVLSELNTIHEDVLVRRRRCVVDNGQVMLTANLMVSIVDGKEEPRLIRDEAELQKIVSDYWG